MQIHSKIQFLDELGAHQNPDGQHCEGRVFDAKSLGMVGVNNNMVVCMTCGKELAADEDGLLQRR